jgi:hypothetical protein
VSSWPGESPRSQKHLTKRQFRDYDVTMHRPGALHRVVKLLAATFFVAVLLPAQVILFESGGLKYQALTRNGVTIMVAQLPTVVRQYAILQVAISNGAPIAWTVKPEDFRFEPTVGTPIQAPAARAVIGDLLERAGRNDVSKLITAYENALYSNAQMHTTNGYEARRRSAMAEVGSTRLKAAAAASAIAFVATKLIPGQSTDGAVFYPNAGKPLGTGKLFVNAAGDVFEFQFDVDPARQSKNR